MSTTKQTRCPHCTSVFNITDDQLAARGGHVRCGSCLQVFRADQHLVDASQIVDIPAAPPQAAAPISTPPVAPKNTSDSQMSMPVVAKEQLANKSYVDLSSKGVKDSLDEHIAKLMDIFILTHLI